MIKCWRGPLELWIASRLKQKTSEELPFNSGAIGFVNYDLIGSSKGTLVPFLKITIRHTRSSLFLYESYVILITKGKKSMWWKRTSIIGRSEAEQAWAWSRNINSGKTSQKEFQGQGHCMLFISTIIWSKEFEEMVASAGLYSGKYVPMCSVSFSADFQVNHWIITAICVTNPFNYLYYMILGNTKLSVPVRKSGVSQGQVVTTNPIAGFCVRGMWKGLIVSSWFGGDPKEKSQNTGCWWSRAQWYWSYRSNGSVKWPNIWKWNSSLCHAPDQCSQVNYFWTSASSGALKATLRGPFRVLPRFELWSESMRQKKRSRRLCGGYWLSLFVTGDLDFAIA